MTINAQRERETKGKRWIERGGGDSTYGVGRSLRGRTGRAKGTKTTVRTSGSVRCLVRFSRLGCLGVVHRGAV